MSALEKTFITPEQYLELERKAEFKSEYYAGEMFAMAGATEAHNLVVTNLIIELGTQMRGRPCRLYANDMKVQVNKTGLYTYPDVVIVCGEAQFSNDKHEVLLNPTVIWEVLSDSTELYDRAEKFEHYRRLPSLTDYLLVSQRSVRVEHLRRRTDDQWLLSVAREPEAVVEITSIDCRARLADIYDKVEFEVRDLPQIRPLG